MLEPSVDAIKGLLSSSVCHVVMYMYMTMYMYICYDYVYLYVCVYVCVYVYMYMYMYTYMYMYMVCSSRVLMPSKCSGSVLQSKHVRKTEPNATDTLSN